MSRLALLILCVELAVIGWFAARMRARSFRRGPDGRFAGRPEQNGWFVAWWTIIPPLLFLGTWALASPALVTNAATSMPATGVPIGHHAGAATLAPASLAVRTRYDAMAGIVALLLALGSGAAAFLRVRPGFAARTHVERIVMLLLLLASLAAILTTAGIVASLLYGTSRFFALVPPGDFLLGTHWSPQSIDPADPGADLGAVPLFWGTFLIGAVIAMAVAVPLGLMSAIYLSQYATAGTRRRLKPLLEVLAGVPTVVYGYFAALNVAPQVRRVGVAIGVADASSESALAAGLVMGVMIVPFVSSMADDALSTVPAAMRDGSLALGATSAETIRRVLLPAALPGVVGGILLAVSRAIGETMIVVMAASGVARLTLDPFAGATTVTKQIVDLLTGEAAFDSAKTLAAFALGLTLFTVTLLLNGVALAIVRRYREAYD